MSMLAFKTKLRWSKSGFMLIFGELVCDPWTYYVSAYPCLLILGAVRRFKRRMKSIWLLKTKGRPRASNHWCNASHGHVIISNAANPENYVPLRIGHSFRAGGVTMNLAPCG